MKVIQPPHNEVAKLVRSHMTQYGMSSSNLVLVVPTLDEVQTAITLGHLGEVSVLWVKGVRFKDVVPGKSRATIQSIMEFETVALNRIEDLELGPDDGAFSFMAGVRTYDHEDFQLHGQFRTRGYRETRYKISHEPQLNVPDSYKLVSFGHGTEFEGEEER